ncbi:Rap1a/Tai family immunity protein [Ferrimonas kyonanensis]|uniref:Rap1a/Tai family immunity protein n=1 Tax=Ferrimonas kyonanensis TaxID=364763 RepID=UPI0012EBEA70|nr:Rap1a/Tai family immunity protein [Ferrimonas kyonanensis]
MKAVLVLCVCLVSTHCLADGNSLLSGCKSTIAMFNGKLGNSTTGVSEGLCLGTINGMRYMNELYSTRLKQHETFFCVPSQVTAGQLVRVVVKYLEENPSQLHIHEGFLISTALATSYPCKTH